MEGDKKLITKEFLLRISNFNDISIHNIDNEFFKRLKQINRKGYEVCVTGKGKKIEWIKIGDITFFKED